MLEANKFWFYSLIFSIIKGVLSLLNDGRSRNSKISSEKKKNQTAPPVSKAKSNRTMKRILADVCDLFIPGFVTGWIPTTLVISGYATVISTVITALEIWDNI